MKKQNNKEKSRVPLRKTHLPGLLSALNNVRNDIKNEITKERLEARKLNSEYTKIRAALTGTNAELTKTRSELIELEVRIDKKFEDLERKQNGRFSKLESLLYGISGDLAFQLTLSRSIYDNKST